MISPRGLEAGGRGARGIAAPLVEELYGDLERAGEMAGELEPVDPRDERIEVFEGVRANAGPGVVVVAAEAFRNSLNGL